MKSGIVFEPFGRGAHAAKIGGESRAPGLPVNPLSIDATLLGICRLCSLGKDKCQPLFQLFPPAGQPMALQHVTFLTNFPENMLSNCLLSGKAINSTRGGGIHDEK